MKKKIKITELSEATVLNGLYILGVNASNEGVKAAISLLRGLDGKEVEMRVTATALQYRLTAGTWKDLLTIAAIQKPAVDAAARADEKLVQISQDVNQLETDLTMSVYELKEELSTSTEEVIKNTNTAKENAIAATKEAVNATRDANTAKGYAETAATTANNAASAANTAAGRVDAAITTAGNATKEAADAASAANTAAGLAAGAAKLAHEKATQANDAAQAADTATGKAKTAIGNAETATKRANDAAAAAENIVSGIRPDWAVDDPTSENYIANKPDIPDWALEAEAPDSFPEAPQDNKTYGRKDGEWSEVNSAGNMDGGTAYSVFGGSLVMDGGSAND